jgi:2'-5' RNA ligase
MRINKNKLTSASKYHVTLLVLRIQNTAEYKELIGILQQAETIFRKYFDDQTIELQLKQVNDVTNNNQVTLSSENILNEDIESDENDDEEDDKEDENSSEEQDEESEEDDDDDSENGEQGEDLEKIKTELKVTEKPVLRFQNVGHFYGSGKCIVWIGLKDDAHKIMLEHLARILYMHSRYQYITPLAYYPP